MKRLWVVSILTGLALASGMVTTAPLAAAHGVTAIASPSQIEYVGRYTGPATCRVLRVHLNGTQPNTGICLDDSQERATRSVGPYFNDNPCQSGDLHIYANAGLTTPIICFYGSGSVNMADWRMNPFQDWNNVASSWLSGWWSGDFYSYPNLGGTKQHFISGYADNFSCGTNRVCNDDLSSFEIH